jgi:hypothetical protein
VNQKGFAQALIFIPLLLFFIAGGIYFYTKTKINTSQKPLETKIINKEIVKPSAKVSDSKEYTNKDLGFSFQYPNELNIKDDSEEEFNKRGNGDFRKNFTGYIQYEPGKFLGGVLVLDKDENFDINPLTIWVFDNPNNLSIDEWYKNYWYYPFVWGDFTYKGKIELAPKQESTISGKLAKSGIIDYQPGKPTFTYLSSNNKIYLLRIIGTSGEKILDSLIFN